MSNVEDLKSRINKVIEEWESEQNTNIVEVFDDEVEMTDSEENLTPAKYRAVRSSSTGDRVYYIDEEARTRAWVTNPEVLKSLGFELEDVTEIEETELAQYKMAPAKYKADE